MSSDKSLVMNGSFENFSKEEVFDVVGLTRQCVEVVFDGESVPETGTVLVKAGRVLEASRPPDQGGKSAFVSLYTDPAAGFRVYTRPLPASVQPLGTLAELIREARKVSKEAGQVVMGGLLEDFSVEEVLDVLSLSRSTMEVQFLRADNSVGRLRCKAGQVLNANVGEVSGIEAFFQIFCDPGQSFQVIRLPELDDLPDPLGPMLELLVEGRSRKASQQGSADVSDSGVMEGALSDTSLEEVLQVISLSRQLLEVVLSDGSGTVGAILVKAGQLLDAQAVRQSHDGADALVWLYQNPGTHFAVFHRRHGARDLTSLGGVAEILRDKAPQTTRRLPKADPDKGPTTSVVMEGSLSDFALREVFDVLSLSRQRLRLMLLDGDSEVGFVTLKAGRVLTAGASDVDGLEAFKTLFQVAADRFVVHRLAEGSEIEPLGMLGEWLALTPSPSEEAPQVTSASELLIEGDFKQFSLTEIFDVLSLSRQLLVVEFRDPSGEVGSLTVKAGRVMACTAGDLLGKDAFQSLRRSPGEQFAVLRQSAVAEGEPLGLLQDWLEAPEKPSRVKREIIMSGSLAEFPLVEVLEVASLSRQLLEVSLRRKDKTRGAILVKSGMVLMARTRRSGKDSEAALVSLLESPGDEFIVLLANWNKALPEPVISIRKLVDRLGGPAPPEAVEPSAQIVESGAVDDVADMADIDAEEDADATVIGALGPGDAATVVLSEQEVVGLIPDETVLLDDMTQLLTLVESLRNQVQNMPAPSSETLDAALESIRRMESDGSGDVEEAVKRALAEHAPGRAWMVLLMVLQGLTLLAVVLLFMSSWV